MPIIITTRFNDYCKICHNPVYEGSRAYRGMDNKVWCLTCNNDVDNIMDIYNTLSPQDKERLLTKIAPTTKTVTSKPSRQLEINADLVKVIGSFSKGTKFTSLEIAKILGIDPDSGASRPHTIIRHPITTNKARILPEAVNKRRLYQII